MKNQIVIFPFLLIILCFGNKITILENELSQTRAEVLLTETNYITLKFVDKNTGNAPTFGTRRDEADYCYFLYKYDSNQNLIWKSDGFFCESIFDSSRIIELKKAIDDGYIVSIWFFTDGLYFMKFNTDGKVVWKKDFSDMGHKSYAWGFEIIDDEYVVYYTDPSLKEYKLRIDVNGNLIEDTGLH